MHHARQHAETKTRERRYRLAHEAARLIAESGIRDFHQAKLKAAARLGIHDDASLPRNREIEDALRALDFFGDFDARLVGPVLEGTADANSPVHLQLYTDDADSVPRFLDEHRIPAEPRSRRVRLDRERALEVPTWLFSAEDLAFDLTVLPHAALRQAPLSSIDEKPMRRASAAQLQALLVEEEVAGFEGAAGRP